MVEIVNLNRYIKILSKGLRVIIVSKVASNLASKVVNRVLRKILTLAVLRVEKKLVIKFRLKIGLTKKRKIIEFMLYIKINSIL